VIVAMVAMRMMQVVINQIIHMVSMRHRLVAASWSMHVAWVVSGTAMLRSTLVGIRRGNLDDVFIDVVAMDMMEMPVVQIVDMAPMMDGCMPATRAVNMRMIGLLGVHGMPRFARPPV
jgi:hypothetical protein